MSNDARVTKSLITVLEDGKAGFAEAARKIEETYRSELATRFQALSVERAEFARELQGLAATYGDQLDDSGSFAAVAHRGWMAIRDMVSGTGPEGVLDVAEQGEDHSVRVFKDALDEDISGDLRTVVERQYIAVKAAHDEVRNARDAVKW
jgi:uncharacterized protein (TIGR02284 family)